METIDTDMQAWIAAHMADDTSRLRLKYHGKPGYGQAIMQIECRRKGAARFPLALASADFVFPTNLSAEQATSEELARIHALIAGYAEGSRHLDLTCGLGMDAFEAARHGASVTAVEIDPVVADAARHNSEVLGLADLMTVINADSAAYINGCADRFDSIFIDPARRGEGGRRLTAIADCAPDVTLLLQRLLGLAPKIIIKASPMLDMTSLAAELDNAAGGAGAVTRMVAVGTARECKELVAVVERGARGSNSVEAFTTLGAEMPPVIFAPAVDLPPLSSSEAAIPNEGDFIYEPYPAVMKTAGWNALCALSPAIRRLHPNTHLFVSGERVKDFPGREMRVERVEQLSDRSLRSLSKAFPMANVATRNFVISAPELEKRLRTKPGGDIHIYGAKAGASASLLLIACRRI